jgi:hypothetical protein
MQGESKAAPRFRITMLEDFRSLRKFGDPRSFSRTPSTQSRPNLKTVNLVSNLVIFASFARDIPILLVAAMPSLCSSYASDTVILNFCFAEPENTPSAPNRTIRLRSGDAPSTLTPDEFAEASSRSAR